MYYCWLEEHRKGLHGILLPTKKILTLEKHAYASCSQNVIYEVRIGSLRRGNWEAGVELGNLDFDFLIYWGNPYLVNNMIAASQ